MKKLSIIIILFISLFCSSSLQHEKIKRVIIVEDTDLQFVNKWVKNNIVECPRKDRKIFIEHLWDKDRLLLVVKSCKLYNIQPSVVLSQMFIESRHRSQSRVSDFVKATNNYFGIEYKDFKMVKTTRYCTGTVEYKRGKYRCRKSFSSFLNFEDCFTAYLSIVSRYRSNNDWNHWKVKMCKHYATDPKYLQSINIITKVNHLADFDSYLKQNENYSNRGLARQGQLEKDKP